MFSKRTLTTFVATAALAAVARADVTPSEPGPGSVYQAGGTCTITWNGDTESTTAWKDMSIQLMTGSNFEMVHITTVATGQDGSVDGRFTYTCPEVTPYSTIYFYQFTAPGSPNKMWATRFTITSPTGETTPPSEPRQPGTNDPIPWGTGALADPSAAVPAPASAGGSGAAPGTGANTTTTTPAATTRTTTPIATSPTTTPATTSNTTRTNTTSDREEAENGASGLVPGNVVLGSIAALASSALALALGL